MTLFPVTLGDPKCPNYPQSTPFPQQVGTVRKRLNDRARFWHRGVPWLRPILHCVGREFEYLQK